MNLREKVVWVELRCPRCNAYFHMIPLGTTVKHLYCKSCGFRGDEISA